MAVGISHGVAGRTDLRVVGSLVDVVALSVERTLCRLAYQLGTPVTIEVVDQELRVVGTGTDVWPQVDAPQLVAVHGIGVKVDVARLAAVRVVLTVRWVPLHDQLVTAVAVKVAYGAVVREVVEARLRGGTVEAQASIDVAPASDGRTGLDHLASSLDDNLVLAVVGATADVDVGSRHPFGRRQHHAVAHDIERRVVAVSGQQSPADKRIGTVLDGYHTTVELFHLRRL